MEEKPHIKGIRIRTVNLIMLCISLALFVIVLYTTVRLSQGYDASVKATETYLNWEKAAHQIHVASDFLTDQTRLFTQTGNRVHADKFFEELVDKRSRESALENLVKSGYMPRNDTTLQQALDRSNALARKEIYAIRLVAEARGLDLETFPQVLGNTSLNADDRNLSPQEKIAKAREIMFDSNYQESKKEILSMLTGFLDINLAKTREQLEQETNKLGKLVSEQRVMLIALCFLNVLIFAMIIVLIVKPLQVYMKCIKDDKMFELVGAYEFKHLALTYNDIFTIKEHHDKMLKHKAEHDPLTGLLNRSAFDSLRNLLKQENESVGLLLVDVDKFKEVNDTYGHAIGDKALCRVASMLQHSFRSNDFCIRLGGDEFAVVMHGMSHDLENTVIDKIAVINDTLQHSQDNVPPLSISVGGAISKKGFSEDLYNNADSALYKVKEAGRRGCAFYHESAPAQTPHAKPLPDA